MAFCRCPSTRLLLTLILALSNATTTVVKTHITSTSIMVNKNAAELHAAEFRLAGREDAAHQGADKRQLQGPASTAAASANPGLLFLVGTHAVTFTGGEVKSIDGTAFSLDPQSRTLYATGSPYYVPVRPEASSNTLAQTSIVPGASNSAQSEDAVESSADQTVPEVLPKQSSSGTGSQNTASSASSVSHSASGVLHPPHSTLPDSETVQTRSQHSEGNAQSTSATTSSSSTNAMSSASISSTVLISSKSQDNERSINSQNLQPSTLPSNSKSGTVETLASSVAVDSTIQDTSSASSASHTTIIAGSASGPAVGGFSSFTNSSVSAANPSSNTANTPAQGTGIFSSSMRPLGPYSNTTSHSRASTSASSATSSKSLSETKSLVNTLAASSSSRDLSIHTGSSPTSDDNPETSSTDDSVSNTRGTTTASARETRASASGRSTLHQAPKEVTLETVEWRQSASLVSCQPPCTLTLPPIPLNTPAVLEYPAITTSICTNVDDVTYTYMTTISVSAATVSELSLKPVPVIPMSRGQPAVTSAADAQYPLGLCSMALPAGYACAVDQSPLSTDGKCGLSNGNATRCPGMQCCSASGQCGTDINACAKESGCQVSHGACWPDGKEGFLPISEVFGPATVSSDCPMAVRPSLPTAGPIIAGATVLTSGTPAATESSTSGGIPPPIAVPGQTALPGQGPVPVPVVPPAPGIPRLCGACGINMDPFRWSLDIGCSGPVCDAIKPQGGGCHGVLCDIFKCRIGCGGGGGKGGGGGGGVGGKPPPPPEDEDEPDPPRNEDGPTKLSQTPVPDKPTPSSSESECETAKTATEITAFCNIVTQFGLFEGNTSSFAAPQTTCTSTKQRITQGCEVTASSTSVFDSCSRTQTATDITKFCTESVSGGMTYTPCTKTVSTVFEGCSVTATTTSVVDEACQAMVTLAPDDPQGEFGSLPQNETCPFYPGVEISPLDDQGQDGTKDNDTCPLFNGTRPTIEDDQGSDDGKSCKAGNGTSSGAGSCPASMANLLQGPDGAEDGRESCPMNSAVIYEPEGALEGDDAPYCNASMPNMNSTMDMDLGQGEDGVEQQSCSLNSNSTLAVDNLQGEDGGSERGGCPVPPDGVVLSPLADQGDYEPMNDSCPILDSRYPVSPMDEQGDDRRLQVSACPIPNITIEEIPDDPLEQSSSFASSTSTGCARPASSPNLGPCSLVIPNSLLTASKTISKPSKTLQAVQVTQLSEGPKKLSGGESKVLAGASQTQSSSVDQRSLINSILRHGPAQPEDVTQGQEDATEGPEDVDLGKSKILAEASQAQSGMVQGRDEGSISGFPWSCACESTGFITTIEATTICGQPMCPNWVSLTPLSESVSHPTDLPTLSPVSTETSEEDLEPPPPPTSAYTSCQCGVPKFKNLGACTLQTTTNVWTQVMGQAISCECEIGGGVRTTIPQMEVCGQTVCPNPVDGTTMTIPSECPASACVPPLTTAHGVCSLNSHTYKSAGAWSTGWECVCNGQHGSFVNVQTGCNNSPVCPNQADIVTRIPHWKKIWADGFPEVWNSECWTALPSLLYFDTCKLSTVKQGTVPPWKPSYEACFCGVAGDDELSAVFTPSYTGCGGHWLCPNSAAIPTSVQKERRRRRSAYSYEDLLQLPTATATAVGRVIPVVTDATPGSVPVAVSKPTKMATHQR